jgi:hypothetical protein
LSERPERPNQRSEVEWLADALGSRAFGESISQITDHLARSFKPIEFKIPSWLEEFNRAQTRWHAEFASWAAKMAPTFALIQQIGLLNKAHWIAHPALPIGDLIGEQSDPERIGETVADYVEQHLQESIKFSKAGFPATIAAIRLRLSHLSSSKLTGIAYFI